jgi:hypothetical protein
LLTKGWSGSSCIGLVPPGTTEKLVWNVSHPALFDEKSGGDAFCCAAAPGERSQSEAGQDAASYQFCGRSECGHFFLLEQRTAREQLWFNVTTIASQCGRERYGPN